MKKRAKSLAKRRRTNSKAASAELPARVNGRADPSAHVNRPVKNCPCPQCQEHRRRDRRARRDALDSTFYAVLFGPMTARAAANATAEFKAALGIQ